ncbi:hypothetical protein ACNKHT_16885 [Shigella flexneri]
MSLCDELVRRALLQEARRLFSEAGLPTYRTPEGTITAFMHMVEYRRNQKQLRERRCCRAI